MHKMTKATAIPQSVKVVVWARDNHQCVICGSSAGAPVAHVVRRSQGGRGIEQNIATLCPRCHRLFDEGPLRDRERIYVRLVAHMKAFYPDWNREDMIYRKGAISC